MMFEETTNSSEVVTINTSSSSLMIGGTTITSSMNVEMTVVTTRGLAVELVDEDFILNTNRTFLLGVDSIKTSLTTDSKTIVTSSRQHGEI